MAKFISGVYLTENRVWQQETKLNSKGKRQYHLISWSISRCIDCGQFLKAYHSVGKRCHKCSVKIRKVMRNDRY